MTDYEKKKKYYIENPDKAREIRRKYYEKTRKNAHNKSKRWTDIDDRILCTIRVSDRELSEVLGRSMQSIQTRRARLRKRGLYVD